MPNSVITIARQFGSGGRDVAKKVSELMNIPFYDKDLIALAAKESGLSEELFEGIDEKPTNSLLYSLVMGLQTKDSPYFRYGDMFNSDSIFRIQSKVIRNIADKGPCVLVGRCYDYILREYDNTINVFIHADEDQRVHRIMEKYGLKEMTALDVITKNDKRRSSFYNFYTNKAWSNAENYHLSIDTTKIGAEKAAELIVRYAEMHES